MLLKIDDFSESTFFTILIFSYSLRLSYDDSFISFAYKLSSSFLSYFSLKFRLFRWGYFRKLLTDSSFFEVIFLLDCFFPLNFYVWVSFILLWYFYHCMYAHLIFMASDIIQNVRLQLLQSVQESWMQHAKFLDFWQLLVQKFLKFFV